jgi:hypothetical protein
MATAVTCRSVLWPVVSLLLLLLVAGVCRAHIFNEFASSFSSSFFYSSSRSHHARTHRTVVVSEGISGLAYDYFWYKDNGTITFEAISVSVSDPPTSLMQAFRCFGGEVSSR